MQTVAIICPYSAPSACGIWKRAFSDAQALTNAGYKVVMLTSNVIKGTKKTSPHTEVIDNIQVYRFPVLLNIGGTAKLWYPYRKLAQIKPDIIHVHGYRHPHSLFGLFWGKLRGKKVILTTHAPFQKDKRRSWYLKLMDIAYDIIWGWWELRLYNEVIKIAGWETKPLARRGRKNAVYIPNGIDKQLVEAKPQFHKTPTNRIMYMGRLDPVKRVEWLVQAAQAFQDKHFVLYGPNHGYHFDDGTLNGVPIGNNVEIIDKTYHIQDFIEWVGKSDIYVLPSIREALGITLLEAMALGKIVIASDALGPQDIIEDGVNGFIVKSQVELDRKIKEVYENWDTMGIVARNARETAEGYNAEMLGEELVALYNKGVVNIE